MEHEVIEKEDRYLIGFQHHGSMLNKKDPIEDQIEALWGRFSRFCQESWPAIKDKVVNPKLSYELQIWDEKELQDSGDVYVFVGVEVEELKDIPLELSGKVLPAGKYIYFKLKGKEIKTWEEDILQDWFPRDDYWIRSFEDHLFHVQCFHEEKFKGIENLEDSELNVLVPVDEVD